MRVIAGTARSLRLETIDSMDTRPTTDRIKETLFNILAPDIPGADFLDLFSGSGAIAIEALSRGAEHAVLVEQNKKAARCIRKNLTFTGLSERAELIVGDVMHAISELNRRRMTFDIIFMDPPYGRLLERDALYRLAETKLLAPSGEIIIESDLDTGFDYLPELGLELFRVKKYKTNMHAFIRERKEI